MALTHRCFADATAILCVSRGVSDYVARFPEARGKAFVAANGVDLERFDVSRQPPGDRMTFCFVGTLRPWHGVENLARAFLRLWRERPQLRLRVVGDGPAAASLQAVVSENPESIGAIECVGAVPPERIPSLLADCQVGVAPYPPLDGFYFSPLKIAEYMAAGLPVVASRQGDIPEYLEHGRTGWLYDPRDPEALFGALRAAADSRPATIGQMGRAARAEVAARFTWRSVARRVLAEALRAPRVSRRDFSSSGSPDREPTWVGS
jgi:glycosyltransferase involved in cell wall biosynthesis